MSYILEGLKKLEQKRRQNESPAHLLAFREENTRIPKKPILWPYLLFIGLLLNAGIIIWWLGPWPTGGRSTLPHPVGPDLTVNRFSTPPVEFKAQSGPVLKKESSPSKIINEQPKRPVPEKQKKARPLL